LEKLYGDEQKKRKKAEQVANNYYHEWRAERQAKDQALANQVYKPASNLPDSCYLSDDLLDFNFNGAEEIIGAGVFGTVKRCQYKGNIVAVKCFKTEVASLSSTKQSVLQEAKVLLNLKSHRSIPTLLGVSLEKEPFKLVMQFYGIEGKSLSLHSVCKSEKLQNIMNQSQWNTIIKCIAKAIEHIHACGYIHNDIKTDNVVLYKSGDTTFIPVVVDFGKSCKREEGITKRMSLEEQSEYRKKYKHIAPEIVDGSHKQSMYSDIYSFGYLVYNIYTYLCKDSAVLHSIVNQCYKVKSWSCRASFSKVVHLLEQ
jgi:serine/threonine protein kinase